MEFNFNKFISMTELQKISSKKLKRLGTPLVVLNRKSKRGGFVILDLEKFDEMEKGTAGLQPVLKKQARQAKETPNFRGMGLLWDRSEMSNRAFYKKLKDPSERDHAWAAKRFLEYAPSRVVTRLLSLEEIKELLLKTSLRFGLKEAWQNAVHYWSIDDILSNKMGCLISRNEVKDYVDLFYLIPASHLTAKELLELGLKKEGGLDPVIMAHQMEFIFREPVPAAALLGKIPWEEFKLFFRKFQKECLDLIRPKD